MHFYYQDALELWQPIFSRKIYRESMLQWKFTYNEKAVGVESSARWCFANKKIL